MAAALIALVACVGCSNESAHGLLSVTAPSEKMTGPTGVDVVPVPPVDRPSMSVSGPSGCVEMAGQTDVLTWTIAHVPADAVIQKAYAHDNAVGCRPTEANLRTQNEHLRFEWVGTTLIVQFDRATYDCGRTQVDLSINGQLAIGIVGRYARDCDPPALLDSQCRAGVASVNLFEASSLAVAYVAVKPGYRIELTLRSYTTTAAFLPQFLFANAWATLEEGTHTMTASLPRFGRMQSDLYCGRWPLEDLTEANFAAYDAAALAYIWRN